MIEEAPRLGQDQSNLTTATSTQHNPPAIQIVTQSADRSGGAATRTSSKGSFDELTVRWLGRTMPAV
jgi:hypothetical protein